MGRQRDKRMEDSGLCSREKWNRMDMRVQMWKDKEAEGVERNKWKE